MANYKTQIRKTKQGFTIRVEEYGPDFADALDRLLVQDAVPFQVFEKSAGLISSVVKVQYVGSLEDRPLFDRVFKRKYQAARR